MATATVDCILQMYADDSMYAELTQTDHALQCALLAEEAGADTETIVAALLHDIGWKLAGEVDEDFSGDDMHHRSSDSLAARLGILVHCGTPDANAEQQRAQHDVIGATYLRMLGFHEKVADLVEGHVLAKRYLCFRDPNYFEGLSTASKRTLAYQGGIMTEHEARVFESCHLFEECLSLRRWDEEAKVPGKKTRGLHEYRDLIASCLVRPAQTPANALGATSFVRDHNKLLAVH
eukprot:m.362250 g.362250  ORF g.362250 m.362250 type:complete len:235 (+) comp56013_c1_seq32:323-1027(+)